MGVICCAENKKEEKKKTDAEGVKIQIIEIKSHLRLQEKKSENKSSNKSKKSPNRSFLDVSEVNLPLPIPERIAPLSRTESSLKVHNLGLSLTKKRSENSAIKEKKSKAKAKRTLKTGLVSYSDLLGSENISVEKELKSPGQCKRKLKQKRKISFDRSKRSTFNIYLT